MSSQFFNQGTPAREIRREQQTTLEYGSQSGTEREECRPISPRALFEDLPTAHSSITSRITNQRNNLFLMSPHTDHSINDLNMEVPLDMTADRSPVTRPPNCSGLLTSYFVENKAIDRPFQEIESTSIPLQDGIEDPRTTLADLVVRGASIGQLSSYFSGKPSRSSCQPQGEVTKRYTSKLIKPRPSGVKHFFQWKKLRASGAPSLLSNLTTRQLNPQTAHSRAKKGSSSEEALANGVRTNNSYLVDPQLSTHLSCEERRHGYQGNPISSLNFSKPIHPLASHPTGVNTGMSPIPYSPGCSNLRPSLDSHRANNILERLHGISSQTSPRHGSDPTLIMCGDPGTIQSSSISGIAENDFPGDEYEDMGPGSSQTTSSPRLSGLGTFSSLRSRLKLPSTLSSRSKGSGLRTNICNMKSLSKENEGLADQMEFGSALESNTKLEGSMWNEEEDAQTWQTVAESQQFRSDMRSDFSKVDTGSSLANFSSYGSLANAETQPWSSLQLLGKHQDFPSYPSNPVTAHPGQRDPAHPHRLHQRPTTGNDILPPVYQYDMSMSVLNEDSSSRVRIQHKHNPFSSTKHNTTNNPTSILSHPFKYFNSHPKRPFSHKYPRMSIQHSLPLTAAIRSSPRDYFASDGRKQGDVLQMPERAHLAAFSSTDQLILDPLLNSSPPRLRDRSSGDGITPTTCNGTGSSHKSQSLISETRLQHGQRPAIPKLRWPLTHGNDNETAKSRVKSPSREDLVRERIRQLNDPILATTSRQNRRDPPPRPVSERSTIPHRSHTVTSRLVNINEELETGQWYCSENGRYAFSTPPRLFRMSTKSRQRDNVVASTSTTGFALQRRVGREVIIGSTIMLPLGWLLLAYIAMVGQRANWLINWRSRGEVAQFHEKDIRFARQVFGGVFLVLIIIGFVTATGVLASRDSK
ncbi:predicted protein [Histoplasma capsulatum G186AR]|uniref:Uncharacterized protein n=1 Tax=Ajellomyces capsulatus (strain G186AR / H82 / ATCC MYA-2454 / RMSCC 2432) TaxID=447093 RepID=C0NHC9_AJECG|nr:uncharacterized protein HCBG_02751 [Histoplasma capsulatum G186AR]EEH09214.1 predicted protein [Histoplasma capsulatum G186AR]